MARGRRTRGTWFPNIGTEIVPDEDTASGRAFTVNLPLGSSQVTTGILPLTLDTPFEGENVQAGVDSLSDIIGSEYVLQRIVGKLYIERRTGQSLATGRDQDPAVMVCCGFFVARANDAAVGGGQDTPIGSATEAERRDNYSPLEVDTVREPWIWRRTWILGAAGRTPTSNSGGPYTTEKPAAGAYPPTTAGYGSVADGPHIDSRVKRRISQDNRLWFAISATPFPFGDETVTGNLQLSGYLDYRIFGSLRKARNSSAF